MPKLFAHARSIGAALTITAMIGAVKQFSSENFRSLLRCCALALLYAVIFGAFGFDRAANAKIVEGGVETTVAGHLYHILHGYLQYPVGDDEYGFLLAAELPDMSPPSNTFPGLSAHVLIDVQDQSTTTDPAFRLGVAKKIYGPLKPRGKRFGLSYYLGSTEGIAPRTHIPAVPPEQTFEEVFISPPPSEVFLTCNGDGAVPYPGCDEVFRADGLLFQVSFRKPHLREWKRIRVEAIKLVAKFRDLGRDAQHSEGRQ